MGQADQAPSVNAFSRDRLLGGRVLLDQPKGGYRAGMDAALLAAACPAAPGERVLDVGSGAGAVLVQLAARRPEVQLTGLEREPALAALSQANAALNGMEGRLEALTGDAFRPFTALERAPFDWVLTNPPFFDGEAAIRGPAPARRSAWIADEGLRPWLAFMLKAVKQNGRLVIVHRADRLGDILSGLAEKCGSFAVRPVHAYADEPAKRVLVLAIKSGKAPLRLLPPLVLHDRSGGKHTPEAEAILRGEAALGWD
ncbi:methyltransferase [Brevundimonas sp. 2R-24]|uniref:Methyltransferase n=1 Tax=Peiella sedimenti TaxID=3061083 RepID=A0ABT8SI25_9CAUL|nr:methyltransferase [Caulobacteraceae bacterium XZ-24]